MGVCIPRGGLFVCKFSTIFDNFFRNQAYSSAVLPRMYDTCRLDFDSLIHTTTNHSHMYMYVKLCTIINLSPLEAGGEPNNRSRFHLSSLLFIFSLLRKKLFLCLKKDLLRVTSHSPQLEAILRLTRLRSLIISKSDQTSEIRFSWSVE